MPARHLLRILAVAMACGSVCAQERAGSLPQVTVTGKAIREPVEKSYRRMVRGMDLFERRHAMAPQAPLRFKLLPRNRDTDMRDIQLDVVGNTVEINIPVAPDNTFVLPRDQRALAEDAKVMPDRRAGTMTWRTEIRTPGLPPQVRRLGDLRLECEVGLESGLVSNNTGGVFDQLFGRRERTPDYCGSRDPHYLFFAEQPVFSVSLVHGQRREVLPANRLWGNAVEDANIRDDLPYCDCEVLLDRSYFLPLGDRSWPDDTLVEFEPMAPAVNVADASRTAVGRIVPGVSRRADVVAAFPGAVQVRFDSGYEVWVDRDRPPPRRRADEPEVTDLAERVFLVDPSGVVARARVRLPAGLPVRVWR